MRLSFVQWILCSYYVYLGFSVSYLIENVLGVGVPFRLRVISYYIWGTSPTIHKCSQLSTRWSRLHLISLSIYIKKSTLQMSTIASLPPATSTTGSSAWILAWPGPFKEAYRVYSETTLKGRPTLPSSNSCTILISNPVKDRQGAISRCEKCVDSRTRSKRWLGLNLR